MRFGLGDHHDESAFLDIQYQDLVADPVRVAEAITTELGVPLGAETIADLENHVTSHRQHRFGKHRYSLEQFGLEREAVQARFADYYDRFISH